MDKCGWESLYKELPKPKLKFFSQQQSGKDYLTWIRCNDETLRSFSYLWLYDLISLEPEIRRAVAKAKSLKGVSSTDHPGARHQPFRYHADNACYRIFAALDKVGQLLNTHLSLSINEEDYKKVNFNRIIKSILNNTNLKVIPELLYFAKIKNSPWYKSLSEYRHSLTHRLNPVCEDDTGIYLETGGRRKP